MSLQFACEKCQHPFDVDEKFAGKKGRCKHCGHIMPIPGESDLAAVGHDDGGLKLRPVAGLDVPGEHEPRHPSAPALQVKPLVAADAPLMSMHQADAEKPRDRRPIEVLDPHRFARKQAQRTHLNPHYETRFARFLARVLQHTRDRLYLVTLGLLVLALLGYLFKAKALLHLAAVGIVVANIAMLVDGVLYLVVLPFQHSLAEGLGTLLVPPYAAYYWWKHWARMKRPVVNTVRSFTPLVLVALAYVLYEEAPVIMDKVEKADRVVEKAIGIEPGPENPTPRPRQPSVTDQAKQVLGGEANIIENLAQPQ